MVASEFGDRPLLLDLLKEPVLAVQDFFLLAGRAFGTSFASPHYSDDIVLQMDYHRRRQPADRGHDGILQRRRDGPADVPRAGQYGQIGKTGKLVSITLVRELGPVLTALMVAGRNASGIASELGSMKVTEQIDAMRALGTDPLQKLVTPRLIATAPCCRCSPSSPISWACSAAG